MTDKVSDSPSGTTVVPESFWDAVDENVAKANSSSGGGYWGGFNVIWCYKIFPKKDAGVPLEKTIFEYDPRDKIAREQAYDLAKKAIVEFGLTSKSLAGVLLYMSRANMLNDKKDGEYDASYFIAAFKSWKPKDGGEEVMTDYDSFVVPKLREFNLIGGVDQFGERVAYWGHLNFIKSHRKSADGSDALCCYPDAVYPTRDACIAAMGDEVSAPASSVPVPEGFDADAWNTILPNIQAEIASAKNKADLFKTAKSWGVDPKVITAVAESMNIKF